MKKQILLTLLTSSVVSLALAGATQAGEWVAGDFHQHSTYTDGSNPIATVMYQEDTFGLDWWANSEHGGAFTRDGFGPALTNNFDTGAFARFWDNPAVYPSGTILGDVKVSGGHTNMWRWQSLRDFSFQDVLKARGILRKPIMQALEWNVPGHEHCSVGLIANQFELFNPNVAPLAEFEYRFDGSDSDISGGLAQGWTGKNTVNNHAKAVQAIAWLQTNYPKTSYTVFAHPERKGVGDPNYVGSGSKGYNISDFRDFNNAGPDVAIGFESMPGHQKEGDRGGYTTGAIDGGTFGGCGAYAAKVGGLWDAMLGEGRHFWLFASSDFHNTANDFWPGQYQKTYTFVQEDEPQAILDGLRSGNSFVVEGDLINALNFKARFLLRDATMGETLCVPALRRRATPVEIVIRIKSPAQNHNGDPVRVDHIDLIAGDVTGLVAPDSPDYNNPVNPTTHIVATFSAANWRRNFDGSYEIRTVVLVDRDMYFRLRGTNVPANTPNQTDAGGNPLLDTRPNGAAEAWQDLWFYSNPIFVNVQN